MLSGVFKVLVLFRGRVNDIEEQTGIKRDDTNKTDGPLVNSTVDGQKVDNTGASYQTSSNDAQHKQTER